MRDSRILLERLDRRIDLAANSIEPRAGRRPRHPHELALAHVLGVRAVDDDRVRIPQWLEVRSVRFDDDQSGALAGLERADLVVQVEGSRATPREPPIVAR
jgi:hypothetical protein